MKKSIAVVFLTALYFACTDQVNKEVPIEKGRDLAQQYCGTCHQFPTPELLDKVTWENHILPRMKNMIGLYDYPGQRKELTAGIPSNSTNLYPEQTTMTPEDWELIKAYYLNQAPDSLVIPKKKAISIGELTQFKVREPGFKLSPPITTMVQFGQQGKLYVGDAHTQSFIEVNSKLEINNLAKVNEGAVALSLSDDLFKITVMGSFSPADQTNGMIVMLPKSKNSPPHVPIRDLRRPVHTTYADFNNDGEEDMVISEFGKWAGRLSLHLAKKDKTFESSIILNQTGAIKSEALDFDEDGDLDLISLFGQGNEGFYLHINDGNGNFKTQSLIPLSPSHSSCYFQLFDYNKDGKLDIIYAAGDNADFPPILKPYHGIYIFTQQKDFTFEQSYFYHLNGAYAAIPRDFDEDGDMDIAAISFFPDYESNPAESFVYLKNEDGQFLPSSFNVPERGRWIVMDDGDFDGDGDLDLVLGSLAFEVPGRSHLVQNWIDGGLPFVLLENQKN